MAVKPGYVNPLSMMGQKKTGLTPVAHAQQKDKKSQDVQDLQTKQQVLQNQILLMKSTSDGAVGTEGLEQKLEEISTELKTAKSQEVQMTDMPPARERFDRYESVIGESETSGLYKIQQEKDKYHVLFFPFSEKQ